MWHEGVTALIIYAPEHVIKCRWVKVAPKPNSISAMPSGISISGEGLIQLQDTVGWCMNRFSECVHRAEAEREQTCCKRSEKWTAAFSDTGVSMLIGVLLPLFPCACKL